MASNTENTEGKLAAYIDGQLDPAERAEIERYLAANPEHQKLLSDMIAQRAVLRSLPRDRAPGDIYDAIQAQLERSILLDDAGPASITSVRHSRRSQLVAAAAILALAVGLGGVLYFVLPSNQLSPTEVAVVPHATSMERAATTDAVVEGDLDATTGPVGGIAAAADKETGPLATKSGGPDFTLAASPLLKSGALSNTAPASPTFELLAAQTREVKDLVRQIPTLNATQQGQQSQQLVVLVSTDNPSHASRQVESYLASNNIRWDTVPVAPGVSTATDVAYRAQFRRSAGPDRPASTPAEDHLNREIDPVAARNLGTETAPAKSSSAADLNGRAKLAYNDPQRLKQKYYGSLEDSKKAEPADRTEAKQDAYVADAPAQQQQQQEEVRQPPSQQQELAAVQHSDFEQTQQAQQQAQVQQPLGEAAVTQQQQVQQPQRQFLELQQQSPAPGVGGGAADGRQLIVARGMTRQQAIQLADTLSVNAANQRARLILDESIDGGGQFAGRSEQSLTTAPTATYFDTAQLRDSRQTSAETTRTGKTLGVTAESLRKADAESAATPPVPDESEHRAATTGTPAAPPVAAAPATTTATAPPTTIAAAATQPEAETLDVVILVDPDPAIAAPTTTPAATTSPTSQEAAPSAPNPAPEY